MEYTLKVYFNVFKVYFNVFKVYFNVFKVYFNVPFRDSIGLVLLSLSLSLSCFWRSRRALLF